MTNLEAYSVTYKNPNGEGAMRLSLTVNGIDPDTSDYNEMSMAYAIVDLVMASDFQQGGTQDTLSAEARALQISKARAIFRKNGIDFPLLESNSQIDGKVW